MYNDESNYGNCSYALSAGVCVMQIRNKRQQVYSHRNFTNEIYSLLKRVSNADSAYSVTPAPRIAGIIFGFFHTGVPLVELKTGISMSSPTERFPKLPGGKGAPTLA